LYAQGAAVQEGASGMSPPPLHPRPVPLARFFHVGTVGLELEWILAQLN